MLAPCNDAGLVSIGDKNATGVVKLKVFYRRSDIKRALLISIVVCLFVSSIASAVTIDWVTVGNPENIADTTGAPNPCGAVDYEYQIGKYEVTAGQYTEFLNAVAATDTYGLYNTSMDGSYGCKIQQSGDLNSYTYSVASDWENRPVNYVSWYDSLRFANWLHNGQLAGSQDASTTEDGAYDMSGSSVVRKAGAQVWLPSEDEWYKAAYHKNDGVTGNYFDYPTSSDSTPSNDLSDPDPGNNATFYDYGYTIDGPYYRTEVGAHENSDSPYGTFDMGGNVWEWNEALIGSYRGFRGGSCSDSHDVSSSSVSNLPPLSEDSDVGFRVASVPEPCSLVLLGLGGLTLMRRRRVR